MFMRLICTFLSLLFLPVVIPLTSAMASHEIAYYVSLSGDNENPGTLERPFRTIHRARDFIRKTYVRGMHSNITVYIRGGEYFLKSAIQFSEADSGKNGYTIKYANYPGEKPVLIGGERITNWEKYTDKIYRTRFFGEFYSLYINDKRAIEARHPNQGYLYPEDSTNNNTIRFSESDVPQDIFDTGMLRASTMPGQPKTLTSIIPVTNIDYKERLITLTISPYGGMKSGEGGNGYFLVGSKKFLDMPGEYCYDKNSGYLYYYPEDTQTPIEEQEIIVPIAKEIINVSGADKARLVKNLAFEGLTLKATDAPKTYDHRNENRSSLIYMENVASTTVKNCDLSLSGVSGVVMRLFAQNNTIYGNKIETLGDKGIILEGLKPNLADYINKNNIVSNNLVRHGSQLVEHASGILLLMSGDNEISHNKIYDFGRGGLTLTGDRYVIDYIPDAKKYVNHWDYIYTRNNVISYNDISQCLTKTVDAGSIGSWGTGKGNIYENNYVHDTNHFGIYLDDMSDYSIVRNNVVVSKKEGSGYVPLFMKGMAVHVENNFFINYTAGTMSLQHAMGHIIREQSYKKNIFLSKHPTASSFMQYNDFSSERFSEFESNIYYFPSGNYRYIGHPQVQNITQWKQWKDKRYDQYSIVDEPKLVDVDNEDFRIRFDSPCYQLGIEDIDLSKVGLLDDFTFDESSDKMEKIFVSSDKAGTHANINLKLSESTRLSLIGRTTSGAIRKTDDYTVTYETEDPLVATVSANGEINAISRGKTQITVTVKEGNEIIDKRQVFVFVDDEIEDVSLKAAKTFVALTDYELTLNVSAKSVLGQNIKLAQENKIYIVDNPNIIKVDDQDKITLLSAGDGVVTVQVSDDKGNVKSDSLPIFVRDNVAKEIGFNIDKKGLYLQETIKLNPTVTMSDGSSLTPQADVLKFVSEDENIVKVDETGTVTALSEGTIQIKVSATIDGKEIEGSYSLVVYPGELIPLEEPWDIRHYANASGYVSSEDGTFRVITDASDAWGTSDETFYIYQNVDLERDPRKVIVTATVDKTENTTDSSQFGIDIRANDTPESRHAFLRVNGKPGSEEVYFTYRTNDGGETAFIRSGDIKPGFPTTIKLELYGNEFNAYYMYQGQWQHLANRKIEMDGNVLVGLASFAGRGSKASEMLFRNVSVTYQQLPLDGVKLNIQPSYLENVGDSAKVLVKGLAGPIECNLPEGAQMIYRSSDESVVKVSEDGVVKACGKGEATISATVNLEGNTYSSSATVSVADKQILLNRDVGDVGLQGNYAVDQNGAHVISGAGNDIWYADDGFHYVYKPIKGDGSIIARITKQSVSNSWAKFGLMVRENLDDNGRYAGVMLSPNGNAAMQWRSQVNQNTLSKGLSGIALPYWVKLERQDNAFKGFISQDGDQWKEIVAISIESFPKTAYVGMAVSSHDRTRLGTVTFDGLNDTFESLSIDAHELALSGAVVLMVGKNEAIINMVNKDIDKSGVITPIVIEDQIYVPARFIAENFSAEVYWNDRTEIMTVRYKGQTAEIRPGQNRLIVRFTDSTGESRDWLIDMRGPARVIDDTVYLPSEAVAEILSKWLYQNENGIIIMRDGEINDLNKEIVGNIVAQF